MGNFIEVNCVQTIIGAPSAEDDFRLSKGGNEVGISLESGDAGKREPRFSQYTNKQQITTDGAQKPHDMVNLKK